MRFSNNLFILLSVFALAIPVGALAQEVAPADLGVVAEELAACKSNTISDIKNELSSYETQLETARAKDHMQNVSKHIETAHQCLALAERESDSATGCLKLDFSGDIKLPKENKKKKLIRFACKHTFAIKKAKKRAEQAYNKIQGGMEWKRMDATSSYSAQISTEREPEEGLLGLTSKFIRKSGVSAKDLETCEESLSVEGAFKRFKQEINGGYWTPVAIKSPRSCNEGSDSLFRASGTSQDQNLSFFSDFTKQGIGNINRDRLCRDHATKACFKNLLFKLSCDALGKGDEKIVCNHYADKWLGSCLSGNYENAKYPRTIEEYLNGNTDPATNEVSISSDGSSVLELLQEDISALHSAVHSKNSTGSCVDGQDNLNVVGDISLPERLISNNKTNKFNKFFDVAYGTCVYMRAAAKKSAEIGGTPSGLVIGEQIQGGRYSCKRVAAWTADFNDCAFKMLYGDGMFDAAAVFGGAGIQVKNAIEQGDVMKKQNSEMMGGSPTAALNAQKRNLKNQAENQYIQGGLSGSHAIALTASAADFPTPDKLSTACSDPISKTHFQDETVNCGVAVVVDRNPGLAPEVFANQEVKEALYYKGAEKLMESALATLTGLQLDKQAKDINKIKEEYDKFFQDDAAMPTYEPTNYCEANPSAPSCSASNRVTDSNESFGNIGFQNTGGGNFSFNNAVPDGYTPDEKLTEAEKEARDRLGDIMAPNGSKGNNDFKKVGEASGSSASKVSGGGGGGGGAGGGGGSVASAPKKAESKSNNNYGMKKSSTKRSGGGSVKYQSGGSIAKNKKKNAFDGLLDRNRRRDVATTTLENVSPATSKLFEKISKRYNQVSADKRLYEFESEQ